MARGQSESFERTAAMMKELADTTGALVRGLQNQAQDSQADHAQRQLQATEQMRDFLKELTAIMTASQASSVDATRALVDDLKLQSQTAQQDQASRQKLAAEQMRAFVEQVKTDTAAGREATEQATTSLVQGVRAQGQAAAEAHLQREREAAEKMREFLDQMRHSLAANQDETSRTSNKLLQDLGASAEGLVARLQSQSASADQAHDERQAALAAQAAEILARQGEQVAQLTAAVNSAVGSVRDAVNQISGTTQNHLERMSEGAQQLNQASDRLVDNLGAMRTGTEGLTASAERLNLGASTLSTAVTSVQQTLSDHQTVRDGLATVVADLRQTVENAKREASFTKNLLDGLEVASQRLSDAQRNAEGFLEGVSEVLGQAHAEFASNVQNTLRTSNSAFHQELSQAVNYLKGAIQDLGDVLDAVPARG
jgi:methyl-accepting chemotaxis protein